MADEMRSVFTNAGIALAEQALASKAQIAFTRGVASVADWTARDPNDLKEVTKLDDEAQSTGIDGVATIDEGGGTINASQIDITLIFNQANVEADYDMRTVGLFAAPIVDGKRGAEVLYTITTLDKPQWMSKSVNGNSVTLKIATVVGDTAQLTITLSSPTGDTGGLTQGQLDIFKLNLDKEYDGKYADKAAFDALMARIGGGDSDDAIVTTSSMTQYFADHKADFKGDKGDKGDPGTPGATGAPGDPGADGKNGAQGIPGTAATVAVGTVTKGDTAAVTNSGTATAAKLDFVLPKGDKGDKGDTGAPGAAATIAVGAVTKGDTAAVKNSGSSSAAKFDFTLPKGDPGPAGKDAPANAVLLPQLGGITQVVTITKAAYDALASHPATTLYLISES